MDVLLLVLQGKLDGNMSSWRKESNGKFLYVKAELVHVFFKWKMVINKSLISRYDHYSKRSTVVLLFLNENI